jgi:dihydroorotate dehydrogenase subfamily 1
VVASIWGNTVEQFERAARMLDGLEGVVAVEVNVSCPNLEDRSRMFAHSPSATAEAVHASSASGLPLWVKLSPNVANLVEIAAAGLAAGAEAVVLVNTLLGMAIDADKWGYRLGSGPAGGGLSGPAIRPVALRAVHDCREAFPRGAPGPGGPPVAIVGVGGISSGLDAVEFLMAGADAIEVGTASLRDPRAPLKVLAGLARWCRRHNVRSVRELVAGVQMIQREKSEMKTPTPDTSTQAMPLEHPSAQQTPQQQTPEQQVSVPQSPALYSRVPPPPPRTQPAANRPLDSDSPLGSDSSFGRDSPFDRDSPRPES